MPEGDTIHVTAASLRGALGERPLTGFEAPRTTGPPPLLGERIERIEARGKHLLMRFEGGITLHTHLGMDGSWRIAAPGTAPTRSRGPGRSAAVSTDPAVAICRDAPVVELLDAVDLRHHPRLAALGPDLCLPDPDLDEIGRRLAALADPATEIGVALLDQRVAAGIGNVYRSEVLWACRTDPSAPVGAVDLDTRRALYATACAMLRRNLGGGPRRTVPEGLAVYERTHRPCRRCGTPITSRRLGEHARTVWWCPGCQGVAG